MSGPSKHRLGAAAEGAGTTAYATATREELSALFRSALARGIHGLCFGVYLPGQSPEVGSQITEEQIRARLEIVRPYTRWVRTFSCTDGNEVIPRLAKEAGLKTLVGAWIGADREKNEVELSGLFEVARAGHADVVAIGNEVLLKEVLPEAEMLAYLQRTRAALPGVQVSYVDAYYLWVEHPKVVEACDVLMINCYPFWEYRPLDRALAYMKGMYQSAVKVAGGKPVVISETGWPSAGTPVGEAVPSVENALRYLLATLEWTEAEGIDLFYFAAFDEAWKAGAEGDRGVTWGLWDEAGRLKYG